MPLWALSAIRFFKSPLGRRVGVGLLVLLVATGVYLRGRSDGGEAKAVAIGKEIIEPLRKEMEDGRARLGAELNASRAESARKDTLIAQKDATIEKQAQVLAGLDRRIADLDRDRVVRQQAIANMSDAEALNSLTANLGKRAPGDATPQLYPGEIRAAAGIVEDYKSQAQRIALLESKFTEQAKTVADLKDKSRLQDEKLQLAEGRLQAALDYIEKSDARFKDAYNVIHRMHPRPTWQKVLTLGLLREKRITEITPIVSPEKPAELKP